MYFFRCFDGALGALSDSHLFCLYILVFLDVWGKERVEKCEMCVTFVGIVFFPISFVASHLQQ